MCLNVWCVYTLQTFLSFYIASWLPDPEIEVGSASFYIDGSGSERVSELAVFQGTCIKQFIQNVPKGIYNLKYSYGCKKDVDLSLCQLYIYLNSTVVDSRTAPALNKWYFVSVNVTIPQDNYTFYFKMCGNLSAGWYGIVVTNISMKFVASLPTTTNPPTNNTATNNTATNTTSTNTTSTNTTSTNNTATNNTATNTTSTNNTSTNTTSTNNTATNNTSTNTTSTNNTSTNPSSNDTLNNGSDWTTPSIPSIPSIPSNNSTQNWFPSLNGSSGNITGGDLNSYQKELNYSYSNTSTINNFAVIKMFIRFMNQTIGAVITNSPIVKRTFFSKWFCCLINIDHLWLYLYHNTPRPLKSDIILQEIDDFQSIKWNFIPSKIQNEILHYPDIESILSLKEDRTPIKFYSIQQNTRLFPFFSYKFFLANIPIMVLAFFICKLLNRLLSKLNFPMIFSSFKQNSFLIILLLDGNSEAFTYFLLSDILDLFSQSFFMRFLNFFSIIIFFLMLFSLIAVPFILRYIYEKKTHVQFYDKCKNCLKGSVYFMVDFGLFNMLLGSVHILAENMYRNQLILLFWVQFSYVLYSISNFIGSRNFLNDKLSIWLLLVGSMLRMVFILSFIYYTMAPQDIYNKIDNVQEDLISIHVHLLALAVIFFLIYLLVTLLRRTYKILKKFIEKNKLTHNKNQSVTMKKAKSMAKVKVKEETQTFKKIQDNSCELLTIQCKSNYSKPTVTPRLKTCLSIQRARIDEKCKTCKERIDLKTQIRLDQRKKSNAKKLGFANIVDTLNDSQIGISKVVNKSGYAASYVMQLGIDMSRRTKTLTKKGIEEVRPSMIKFIRGNIKMKSEKCSFIKPEILEIFK